VYILPTTVIQMGAYYYLNWFLLAFAAIEVEIIAHDLKNHDQGLTKQNIEG